MTKKAREFAEEYHGSQKYGDEPYILHLDQVYNKVSHYTPDEHLHIAAYLHDILEDTDCTYSDIVREFHPEVADIVYDATDELGKNRAERKSKTYGKIKNNKKALILKLCDRMTNIENAIRTDKLDILRMYVKETEEFFKNLYDERDITTGMVNIWADLNILTNRAERKLDHKPFKLPTPKDIEQAAYEDYMKKEKYDDVHDRKDGFVNGAEYYKKTVNYSALLNDFLKYLKFEYDVGLPTDTATIIEEYLTEKMMKHIF